jgi:uncharacterized damage-inducible protein DinB
MPPSSFKDHFIDGLVYDHWANGLWLSPVIQFGEDSDRKVFGHILAASEVWVQRTQGVSLPAMPEVPLTKEALDSLLERWTAVVVGQDIEAEIAYRSTKGQPFSNALGDVLRHVLNHGTYHRGQLRESFGRRNLEFPETDFILYAFARDCGEIQT